MSRFKTWSADDECSLRLMFEADYTWNEIALKLDRAPMACEARAKTLGLSRNHTPPRLWTDAEICTIREQWLEGVSDIAIAKLIDRSTVSVRRKRHALGMTRESGDARRIADRSASAAASFEAQAGWPRANAVERARGERLLDRAFGGKPKRDTTPMTRQWMPPHVATQTIGASSSSWAVA